jgi:hypothetical protein
MQHALSTLFLVWGVMIVVTIWIAANALADFGARRLRHWSHSARHHTHAGDE